MTPVRSTWAWQRANLSACVRSSIILAAVSLLCVIPAIHGQETQIVTPTPVTIGNQSAVPRADGTFYVYNVPTGIEWRQRGPNGEPTDLVNQSIFFPFRAATTSAIGQLKSGIFTLDPDVVTHLNAGWQSEGRQAQRLALKTPDKKDIPTEIAYSGVVVCQLFERKKIRDTWETLPIKYPRLLCIWVSDPNVASVFIPPPSLTDLDLNGIFNLYPKEVKKDTKLIVTAFYEGASISSVFTVKGNPDEYDSDGDGLPNYWEKRWGFDYLTKDEGPDDADGDGWNNLREFERGTNPRDPDTDQDGLRDNVDGDPLNPERISPVVQILSPTSQEQGTIGKSLHFRVKGLDNAKVRRLEIAVGGSVIGAALGETLDVDFIPREIGTVQVVATAIDVAGNLGRASQELVVNDAANDLSIRGRVVDESGNPVAGAEISVIDARSTSSLEDGQFSLEIPANEVPAPVKLVIQSSQSSLAGGYVSFNPPISGEAVLGDIVIHPPGFDSVLGSRNLIPYNQSLAFTLSFPFSFAQGNYSNGHVNAHGAIILGQAAESGVWAVDMPGDASEAVLRALFGQGAPRIAPLWSVANASGLYYTFPGYGDVQEAGSSADPFVGIYIKQEAEGANFTWFNVRHGLDQFTSLNTFQARIKANGGINFAYTRPISGGYEPVSRAVIGISPGGGALGEIVDFSSLGEAQIPSGQSGSELYAGIDSGVDVSDRGVDFERNVNGGYRVSGRAFERYQDAVLAGRVVDQGVPIPDATVRLDSGESTTSNERGYFSFVVSMPKRVLFVAANANGNNDGTSWQDAFTDLQSALDKAREGDEIWVSAGTYYPQPRPSDYGNTPRFVARFGFVPVSVGIYGGFSGSETQRNQRDWKSNVTRLSGDIGVPNVSQDNCNTVIEISSSRSILDGFYISHSLGCGVRSAGTVRHCVIHGHLGTGVELYSRSKLQSCVVTDVRSVNASAVEAGQDAIVESCLIVNNYTQMNTTYIRAAGIHCNIFPASIVGCTIVGNQSFRGTSPVAGGVSSNSSPAAILKNCIIANNTKALGDIEVSGTISAYHSCFATGPFSGAGPGAIFGDPQFLNPDSPLGSDGKYMTSDDGFRLSMTSPCLDRGDIADLAWFEDVAQGSRIAGVGVDLGAYEMNGSLVIEELVTARAIEAPQHRSLTFHKAGVTKKLEHVGIFPHLFNQLGSVDLAPLPPEGIGKITPILGKETATSRRESPRPANSSRSSVRE